MGEMSAWRISATSSGLTKVCPASSAASSFGQRRTVGATLLASAVSALGVAGYLTFSKRFGPVEPPEEPPGESPGSLSPKDSAARPVPEPGT